MNVKLLFPSDYFDKKDANPEFSSEYQSAKLAGFDCYIFDEEEFFASGEVKVNFKSDIPTKFIYRGWMMKMSEYIRFYDKLVKKNIVLINNGYEYLHGHHFDFAYCCNSIRDNTPAILSFQKVEEFDFTLIKKTFKNYFMIKDNVKSLKDDNFPKKIPVDIEYERFKNLIETFIDKRGSLYTGGIILKQYVDLKMYGEHTNEYRLFFTKNHLITSTRNSNQDDTTSLPPYSLVSGLHKNNFLVTYMLPLASNFYTVDVAELETPYYGKTWVVLECGDGQVSGLSPNQNQLEFYTKLKEALSNEEI